MAFWVAKLSVAFVLNFSLILNQEKRKRLHSDTCSHSKQILEGLLLSTRKATLTDFLETMRSDAYLCYQCDGKASSLHKLQQRGITEVQNELLDKLKGLHEVTSIGPRKRLYINEQTSADKHTRLDPQSSQNVPETTEVSSDHSNLDHDDVNSGDHSILSESHNLVESESNQELHPLATKSKSPALSVSTNISYIVVLFSIIICTL